MLYLREDYFDRVGPIPPLPASTWRRLRAGARWLAIAGLLMSLSASTTIVPNVEGLRFGTFVGIETSRHGSPYQLVNGAVIELTLTRRTVGARAGCNSMGGPAGIEGGRLVTRGEGLSMSILSCLPGGWEQDVWLNEFLESRPVVVVDGNRLMLASGNTTITLIRQP